MTTATIPDQLLADPQLPGRYWLPVRDGDARARALYQRHYSARRYRDGHVAKKIVGPGEYLMLLTPDARALFVWRRFWDASGQRGVNCAVFHNEGPVLSSELIAEGCRFAWDRWPGCRLYTYVNPGKVRSRNPGWCFLCAGWRRCGWTKGGHGRAQLLVLEIYAPGPRPTRKAVARAEGLTLDGKKGANP